MYLDMSLHATHPCEHVTGGISLGPVTKWPRERGGFNVHMPFNGDAWGAWCVDILGRVYTPLMGMMDEVHGAWCMRILGAHTPL